MHHAERDKIELEVVALRVLITKNLRRYYLCVRTSVSPPPPVCAIEVA